MFIDASAVLPADATGHHVTMSSNISINADETERNGWFIVILLVIGAGGVT